MTDYGLLTNVSALPRATTLDAAASIGDTTLTVDYAGDFDSIEGGTLDLNGARLAYTGITDGAQPSDSDTITLAAPLAVGADLGDTVSVVAGGQILTDYVAHVTMGIGDEVHVPLDVYQVGAWPLGDYTDPVPVEVSDDLRELLDAPGWTATGTADPPGAGDAVPVGTTGYTVTSGYGGARVYRSANPSAVVFASALASDAHPRQYVFADPEAGIYWSDGTVDPLTGGINLYLQDNATMVLAGSLNIKNGPLGIQGGAKIVFLLRPGFDGTAATIGDASTDGTAPWMVGLGGMTTGSRTGVTIAATTDHYMVFDTTLGKPVWSDGSGGWVDATGATV